MLLNVVANIIYDFQFTAVESAFKTKQGQLSK